MLKTEYLNALDDMVEVLRENSLLSDSFAKDIEEKKHKVIDFQGRILFVGSFSAGKSALINAVLGDEEILKENLSPETALATELIYGEDEQIVLVNKDGSIVEIGNNDTKNYSIENAEKYLYTLKRDILKKLDRKIIVDMPGFDSGIEAHNNAILQYIDRAVAYVFVVDVTKGTISKSSLDFLSEIRDITEAIYFVITKCDLVSDEVRDRVKEDINSNVSVALGKTPEIVLTASSRDKTSGKAVGDLLLSISLEKLEKEKLGQEIAYFIQRAINMMCAKLEPIDYNPGKISEEIRYSERILEKYKKVLKRKKADIHNDLHNKAEFILNDVRNALLMNDNTLASASRGGNAVFSTAVNNIIRPILVTSTNKYMEDSFNDFMNMLEATDVEYRDINHDDLGETIRNTKKGIVFLLEKVGAFAGRKKYASMYKVVSGTLAITTSVVAPVLELVIFFLPEIISFLNGLGEQSKEERLCKEIRETVIPRICDRLRPTIQENLTEIEVQQLEEIQVQFTKLIEDKENTLQQLLKEREETKSDIEIQKHKLEEGVNKLHKLAVRLGNYQE